MFFSHGLFSCKGSAKDFVCGDIYIYIYYISNNKPEGKLTGYIFKDFGLNKEKLTRAEFEPTTYIYIYFFYFIFLFFLFFIFRFSLLTLYSALGLCVYCALLERYIIIIIIKNATMKFAQVGFIVYIIGLKQSTLPLKKK